MKIKNDTRMVTSESLSSMSPLASAPHRAGTVPARLSTDSRRIDSTTPSALTGSEEVLVVDDRSGLSPAQAVENRLSRLLNGASLPVSHLQTRGMLRRR